MNLTIPKYTLPQTPVFRPLLIPTEFAARNAIPPFFPNRTPPSIPTFKWDSPPIINPSRYLPPEHYHLLPPPTSALELAFLFLPLISLILAPLFLVCVHELSERYEKWKAERNPPNPLAQRTVTQIQPDGTDIIYLPQDHYKMAEALITNKGAHQIDVSRK